MASPGTNRVLKIMAIVVVSLLAIAVAAAAVIAGVVESGKQTSSVGEVTVQPKQTASPSLEVAWATASPEATREPESTAKPEATREAEPTTQTTFEAPPAAVAPEVIQTIQARVPEAPPAAAPEPTKVCPSGTVVSGLTDVTVTGQREWIVGHLVDLRGHGRIHNATTAAVDIWLYLPYVQGLDAAGRLTMNSFSGDFDYNPPPGTPRPGTLSLSPGQALTYTFTAKDITSDNMRETVAWYADPNEPVGHYSAIQTQIDCPDVIVTSPPGGPSIPNTYPGT